MTLPVTKIISVLNDSIYIITSITTRPIKLTVILAFMSVSTYESAVQMCTVILFFVHSNIKQKKIIIIKKIERNTKN